MRVPILVVATAAVFLPSCQTLEAQRRAEQIEINTSEVNLASRLPALEGDRVCVVGALRVGGHDVYFPLAQRRVEVIYGDRIKVDMRPVQAVATGMADGSTYRICGTMHDLGYRDAEGVSQNAFLLLDLY